MRFHNILFLFIIFSLISGSCRKELFSDDPSARLQFSTDTEHFDTVFVTIGSATKNFKVTNPHNQSVKISNIRLAGGENSAYRINIDGRATTLFQDYELAAKDSMYIFVEVTVDPNNQALPFVVEDSIMFETNGNTQKVILTAFGQNAHFFENEYLGCDTTWVNDGKPYVIYRSVAVSPACKLTIERGVKVYSHKGSGIFVYGTLEVNGTKDEPVIFRGDRLEKVYEDEPGQWYGIRFVPKSHSNKIKHAIISNAQVGIEVDSLPVIGLYNLEIEKSIIRHMTVAGIVGFSSAIDGKNLLVHSCEQLTFLGELGGNYRFTHCTFENSNTKTSRRTPSFVISNADFFDEINNVLYSYDLNTEFRNCIIWGNLEEEMKFTKIGKGAFDTTFLYNFVKTKDIQFNATNFRNKNPRLENTFKHQYHLNLNSPAINAGIKFPAIPVADDIIENPRDDKPDAGCYEFK
ncbi:MAG: hypothetical protein ACXWDO_04900 [Bacteroidia bacterium]